MKNKKNTDSDKLLLTFALIAVIISLLATGLTYMSITNLISKISGLVTSTGQANLTVESAANINFTTNFISWGSGRVSAGADSAELRTFADNVSNGNWSLTTAGGLRIQNIGNVNVSLNLTAGKSAAAFIGGTSPGYQWNVSNLEASSCLNSTGGTGALSLGTFSATSTTTTNFCGIFQFVDSADTVRIDLNLTIPSDSLTGALTDTITALAVAV